MIVLMRFDSLTFQFSPPTSSGGLVSEYVTAVNGVPSITLVSVYAMANSI
jgi:hypothetical protein